MTFQTPGLPVDLVALRPALLRLAQHLTSNKSEAEDLCQDVLLRLLTRLHEGGEIEDLRPYAMAALRNAYRQSLRERVAMGELEEDILSVPPVAPARLALNDIERALKKLPAEQALLIRLVAGGETSPQALARQTGWPEGTVMSRLARARARLRVAMGLKAGSEAESLCRWD